MTSKTAINTICIALLPLLIFLSGYFLVSGSYLYSLIALIAIVLCMETRVRMGYRGVRGWVFSTHLLSSVLLLVLLVLLTRHASTSLLPFAYLAFAGMLMTGIILIRGSWQAVLK